MRHTINLIWRLAVSLMLSALYWSQRFKPHFVSFTQHEGTNSPCDNKHGDILDGAIAQRSEFGKGAIISFNVRPLLVFHAA